MKIDIEPVIEKANEIDRICIDMREIEALYVVRLANGKDYTVKWDKKEMKTFCPNKTVSEMIKSWEDNIVARHGEAVEALKTGIHPTRTVDREILHPITGTSYSPKQYETVRKELDSYEKAHFRRVIKDLEQEFGKMTFVKIV